ncbi:MAG: carboxypeptidase regulatory-like domain-containing protein [Chloracidobacterium sp.]|nr:carboxypeptidase regulatory-like domain-containing protein [Chloracidobacterium sp.]MCO5334418.1 carboxypeptidase-like regulatory domain-containing protein [Pyrinomonadaceae bacterium]
MPVSGVVTDVNGRAVSKASVVMTDAAGNSLRTITGPFGYFRFDEVESGQTYVITATAKRYTFQPQTVAVTDEVTDLRITADQ